jgi:hypothetical protein
MRVGRSSLTGTAILLLFSAFTAADAGDYDGVGPGFQGLNRQDQLFGGRQPDPPAPNDGGSAGDFFFDRALEMLIDKCIQTDCLKPPPPRASRPASPAYATPTWKVDGGLSMRLRPSLGALKIGEIPPQSGGIRRGQCVQEEWTWKGAVDASGESNNGRVWCEAQFEGQTGWVSAKYLLRE